MEVVHTIPELRAAVARARRSGKSVGFVPTMGCLHDGHLSLIRRAKTEAAYVVVSIFVNPTQFGPNEDFSKYPRTFEDDRRGCQAAGADLIFAPTAADFYPAGASTWVDVRSEEHTSELHSPLNISYAVFCLKKKNTCLNSSHRLTSRMPSSA